jgi:ubiquinone/menaquinone biosynthesis C-methylase UbiE
MLTTDKKIATAEYWDHIYSGQSDSPIDSIKIKKVNPFDRLGEVMKHIEEDRILDVGSGHASLCKRIKDRWPEKHVMASDVSPVAMEKTSFRPYTICDSRCLPFTNKQFDLVVCTSAMECMVDDEAFILEAARVGKNFLCTVPNVEMSGWSQLRIYSEKSLRELFLPVGEFVQLISFPYLILAKVKFND